MAHQITGEQVGSPSQVAFGPSTWGTPEEEHRRPLQRLDLGKAAAQIRSGRTWSPQGQLVHVRAHTWRAVMSSSSAAPNTAPLPARQQGEEAARGWLSARPRRGSRPRGPPGRGRAPRGDGGWGRSARTCGAQIPLPMTGAEAFMVGLHGNGVVLGKPTHRRCSRCSPPPCSTGRGGLGLHPPRAGRPRWRPPDRTGVGGRPPASRTPRRGLWGRPPGGGVQAQDAVGTAQPGEQAVDAGRVGSARSWGHGGEEVLLELEGRPPRGRWSPRRRRAGTGPKTPGAGVKTSSAAPSIFAGSPRAARWASRCAPTGPSVGPPRRGRRQVAQDIGPCRLGAAAGLPSPRR